jgi:hypothetical protein
MLGQPVERIAAGLPCLKVNERGRMPASVREAYDKAVKQPAATNRGAGKNSVTDPAGLFRAQRG